ncbi:MAG TPA: TolC family outer membrane protein [Gammaproteobacteria bacterium]|nr:TolC family outer membrane protein [Gammaproteobacteria bacterium]
MTIKQLCILLTATLGSLGAGTLRADDLMEIYQRALQSDPLIRQAEAIYLATIEAKPQARSSVLPLLSFSAGASTSHSEDPNRPTNFATGVVDPDIANTEVDRDGSNWSLNLSQTVFDWGQFLQLKQADKVVARAEADYQVARQDLLVRVATTYFLVLAAEDTLAAEQAAREAIGRQLEQAQRRFEVGLIAITDVQEAQAAYDLAVATEIEAQQALARSQEFLREIIGEYVQDLAAPADEIPLVSPLPASVEAWVDQALQQNLLLVTERISEEIARDNISIQRSSRMPSVSLSGSYSGTSSDTVRFNNLVNNPPCLQDLPCPPTRTPSTSDSEGYAVSLNLRVPIYTGGFNASRIQQAVYEHRSSIEALERTARETERQTRDAYLSVLSEISRVRALAQAVESSRTALRATEAGFEVGTRTTVDVLVSQNNLRRAETTYARSRYDYILNVLRLKLAAGTLSADDLEQVNGWLQES